MGRSGGRQEFWILKSRVEGEARFLDGKSQQGFTEQGRHHCGNRSRWDKWIRIGFSNMEIVNDLFLSRLHSGAKVYLKNLEERVEKRNEERNWRQTTEATGAEQWGVPGRRMWGKYRGICKMGEITSYFLLFCMIFADSSCTREKQWHRTETESFGDNVCEWRGDAMSRAQAKKVRPWSK